MIVLGNKYRDKVTCFEGIATARYEFLNGCVRFALEGLVGEDGKEKLHVYDEERLVTLDGAAPDGPVESGTGGPQGPIEDLAQQR